MIKWFGEKEKSPRWSAMVRICADCSNLYVGHWKNWNPPYQIDMNTKECPVCGCTEMVVK